MPELPLGGLLRSQISDIKFAPEKVQLNLSSTHLEPKKNWA